MNSLRDPHVSKVTVLLRPGAKRLFAILGILCCLLVFLLPMGVVLLVMAFRSRVELDDDSLTAVGLRTVTMRRGEVERVGVLRVQIRGLLLRIKVGGGEGVNLCWIDRAGQSRRVLLSTFERCGEILAHAAGLAGCPVETLTVGALGPKWPERPSPVPVR